MARVRFGALLAAVTIVLFTCSCSRIPEGRSAIDAVTVRGASKVDSDTVADHVATAPSPKFLGLFRGIIYDYEVFDRATLQRDLARVERFYHAKGYYDVHVRAGRVFPLNGTHVRVEIVVEEGKPVVNNDLVVAGVTGLPPNVVNAFVGAVRKQLPKGEPFDEDKFKAAEADARRALTDHGYAYAKVDRDVFVDLVQHIADAKFSVVPGEIAHFGKVTILGLDPDGKEGPRPQEIPEAPLLRAINIKEGDTYSTAAIARATQALLDMEVFSAVNIVPNLPNPPPPSLVVPLTVQVEPTRLRAFRPGGGIEFDEIKTDVHLVAGWEDHNFLGGLRDFTVDFKPGVVLYPERINNYATPIKPLLEERLRLQLKQPGLFEARTTGFVRPEFNVYPLLVQTNPASNAPVVGYIESKTAVGVDRTFGKFYGSLSYTVQTEYPFEYANGIEPALEGNGIVLAYPDLLVQLDLRDDKVKPHRGIFLANDLQAAGPLGTATDVKIQPEVRTYVPLGRKVTFATRGTLGWLFPVGRDSYGAYVENNPADPNVISNITRRDVSDIETMYFRGFFSGGSNSNRGYPIRGIAPYGYVPFLNPGTASLQVQGGCDPASLAQEAAALTSPSLPPSARAQAAAQAAGPRIAQAKSELQSCLTPIGGFTLWELSNEVRVNISGPFSEATFCDMSDAGPRPGVFRFNYPHLSCGVGGRYETPVGPLRFDIAYRVPFAQVLGQSTESYAADVAKTSYPPRIFSLPIAIAIGIGEAY